MDVLERAPKTAPSRESIVGELVELVASTVRNRVLVVGSLPPQGRDLALIVRPTEESALAERLTAAGLARRGLQWASFFDCTAYLVELIPAKRLSLPEQELTALYAEGISVESGAGLDQIVRPAPHHLLLLLARRFIREGVLHPKRRARIDKALAEDPSAWALAEARATAWGLSRGLQLLERAYRSDTVASRRARARPLLELLASTRGFGERVDLLRRPLRANVPRKNRVVAISGLDGAGKSFQANALHHTLELLVCPTVIEWRPLGQNLAVELVRSVRKLVSSAEDGGAAGEPTLPMSYADLPSDRLTRLREHSLLLTELWTLFVVLTNSGFHRRPTLRYPFRGKIVIFDRYVCDSSVWLSFWYGIDRKFRVQKWLVRVLSPTPLRSFFLDVRPEVALIRKGEMSLGELRRTADLYRKEAERLGVRALDGEEPPAKIAAEIAREVWMSLPAREQSA